VTGVHNGDLLRVKDGQTLEGANMGNEERSIARGSW
jgi:hypothetical protein